MLLKTNLAPDHPDTDREGGRSRGQALVEFSIILPVFFLLVAGMFDFGLGTYSDLTLVNAAREGARIDVIDPGNTVAIESRVRTMPATSTAPSSRSLSPASTPPAARSRAAANRCGCRSTPHASWLSLQAHLPHRDHRR